MIAAPRTDRTPFRRSLTIGLALFLLANTFALNAVLGLVAPPAFNTTVLDHTWRFLTRSTETDSWGPMGRALEYFQTQYRTGLSPIPLYTEIVLNLHVKFQYPPSSLVALFVLSLLGLGVQEQIAFLRGVLTWIFVPLSVVSTAILLEYRLKSNSAHPYDPYDAYDRVFRWLRITTVVCLGFTFYPVVKAYTLGQIQTWINGLFALAVLFWALGRKAPAGVLVGLMSLIKPQYAVFMPWALLRREWQFLLPCIATTAAGGCLSLLVFGWENHVDYLRALSYIGSRGEAYYPNQSVNGLLNRLMSIADPANYNNVTWRGDQFPPFNSLIYVTTLASSALFLGAALFRARRPDDRGSLLDFCIIAISCTLASPIAWEHHYGILLPVFAVLFANLLHHPRQLIWLAVAFTLASNFIPATNLLAQTPFNVVQSYLFFAALIVLLLLYRQSRQASIAAK